MSQPITQDSLFKLLRSYEERMERLERANHLLYEQLDAAKANKIPYVTSFPATPVEGEEILYLANADAGGRQVWHLRYDPNSPSAYKWQVVGAATPLIAQGTPSWVSTSPADLTAGSSALTIARPGWYLVQAGIGYVGQEGANRPSFTYSVGGSQPSQAGDYAMPYVTNGAGLHVPAVYIPVATANQVVAVRVKNAGGVGSRYDIHRVILTAQPVRLN